MKFLSLFFATLLAVILLPIPMVAADTPITPGDNLVVEGIPLIPTDIVKKVERYTQFRSAGISSWHPTKREMLISTRFADTRQTHYVKSPLATRQQLTFFPEPVRGASFQPTEGNYFVFSKDAGGNEFNQNYRYDLDTGEVTLLTDGESKNSRGVLSNSGDRLIYTSTRRTGNDADFYIINPQNPASNKLLTQNEGGGWYGLDWSPNDDKYLALQYVSVNESYLWLIDTSTGEKQKLLPKEGEEKISYDGAYFS